MSETRAAAPGIGRARAPVSVVVPCYRCAATVRRAVASVAQQSLLPEELILVDDASGDGTLERLRDVAREFGAPWIKVLALDRNQGPGGARNAGWQAATGKFVAFLDADDTWHPRKLEIQVAFMQAHPEVALCGHGHLRIADGDRLDTPLERPGYRVVSRAALLRSNRFVTPSVMLRREIPQRFHPGRRHMEDHLLWSEVACDGLPVARLNETLAFLYKASVGDAGLSRDAWTMRKAELANFWTLHRSHRLGFVSALGLCAYALAKHLVRAALLAERRVRDAGR